MITRSRQAGATFIGRLVLLIPVVLVAYGVLRLMPPAVNYYRVVTVMQRVGKEFSGDAQVTSAQLRDALDKRLEIEGIEFPAAQDFSFVLEDGVWIASVRYDDQVPLFLNLFLVVRFDRTVRFK